jgi:predicted TIM-barrel fold metal-dependent hydrolase
MPAKPLVIALEEHFQHPDVGAAYGPLDANRAPPLLRRLEDLGAGRIKETDEIGIDIQVISHTAPAMQKMTDAESAVRLARLANDRLHQAVRAHAGRFAGFASLPTPDPKAAAGELGRAVTRMGFKGAMIHGLTNGRFHDDKQFWPIFERARALDVPIYFHPSVPDPAVVDAYYKDYAEAVPGILRAARGFTLETATQGVRLVLSGVFDAYPGLKVIFDHLGEGLPFYARASTWRSAGSGNRAAPSAMCSANISTSTRSASGPIRRCCAASRSLAWTASCSRWTARSRRTSQRRRGCTACSYARRTGRSWRVGTPGGC